MSTVSERLAYFDAAIKRRILVLDGSMGAYMQALNLQETDFRGARFAHHDRALRGNGDVLCLTQPDLVTQVHHAYLEAGADIIETNTFGSTIISQAEYGLESQVREMNEAGARLAREACDAFEARDGAPRLVAGALGPTTKLLSMSPRMSDPAFRDCTFDDMAAAYKQQALGLMAGGADLLLIETITDTLNAKAALWGVWEASEEIGVAAPIWLSATITDRSGRTLSGQTVEAFWNSIVHAKPWAVGLNCALGPHDMRPFLADLARVAECPVAAYPNAGLPNAMGGYDETPQRMEGHYREWAQAGLVNILGGCCGTTPAHIARLKSAVEGLEPRRISRAAPRLRLAGLEPFNAAQ